MDVIIKHLDDNPDGSATALVQITCTQLPRGSMTREVRVPAARCAEIEAEAAGDKAAEGALLHEEILARATDVYSHAVSTAPAAPRRLKGAALEARFGRPCQVKGLVSHELAGTSEYERMRPAQAEDDAARAGLRPVARPGKPGPQTHRGRKDGRQD